MAGKSVTLKDVNGTLIWTFKDAGVRMVYSNDLDQYYTGEVLAEVQKEITQVRKWIISGRINATTGSTPAGGDASVKDQVNQMRTTVFSQEDKMSLIITYPDDTTLTVTGTVELVSINMVPGRVTGYDYTFNFWEADTVFTV